jgi:hypothetical protein
MTGSSFTIPAGTAPGTYYLRLVAVYSLGNSLASNEVTLTVPAPTDLAAALRARE